MDGILERFPGIRCPRCAGKLVLQTDDLECIGCQAIYALLEGSIPVLVTGLTSTSDEEHAVQEAAALSYETVRHSSPWARVFRDRMQQKVLSALPETGRVLDVGCGVGTTFEAMPRHDVTGLDISLKAVRLAHQRGGRVLVGDLLEIPFEDRSFDAVLCRGVLHHVPELDRAIAELARVLRPGGILVASEPNTSLFSTLPRLASYALRRGEVFSGDHREIGSGTVLCSLARAFEVVRVEHFGLLTYPFAFPDIVDLSKVVPLRSWIFPILLKIDESVARTSLARWVCWTFIVRARLLSNHDTAVDRSY